MVNWDIKPGETLLRKELHDRWGGARYGGMEPSRVADSVFLFSKPSEGAKYGYRYDGWSEDGFFYYTGDGQEGDQSTERGGNRALLKTKDNGRAIRVFWSVGTNTTYIGEFALGEPPYVRRQAPDVSGEGLREVLVFKLIPGEGARVDLLEPLSDLVVLTAVDIPIESSMEAYLTGRLAQLTRNEPGENRLVWDYQRWLLGRGTAVSRQKVPLPDGGVMYTDIFDLKRMELIEAKGDCARKSIRLALGQILDYSRYVPHEALAILTPERPQQDLVELLRHHGVSSIWRFGDDFKRSDC